VAVSAAGVKRARRPLRAGSKPERTDDRVALLTWLEARVVLDAILACCRAIELAAPALVWSDSLAFRGLAALPLCLVRRRGGAPGAAREWVPGTLPSCGSAVASTTSRIGS